MIRTAFAAGFAFAVGMGSVGSAKAGLFDFLFAPRRPAAVAIAPVAEHPSVTIAPRRKPKAVRTVRRIVIDPKEQLARTIDPVKNPRWYLEDPTLRKGDVLVLADRVLVFKGGVLGDPRSYVALNQTRLLTRDERARVAAMTRQNAAPVLNADAAPAPARRMRAADLRRLPAERG